MDAVSEAFDLPGRQVTRRTPPQEFRRAWDADGAVKVTGFLSPLRAAELRNVVENVYRLIASEIACGGAIDATLRTNFTNWDGVALGSLGPFLAANAPATRRQLADVVGDIRHGLCDLFKPRLWRLVPERSFFRRHRDAGKYVPWHIDADAARTASFGPDCLNVWLPLDDVGSAAPSLEFALGSHAEMRRVALLDSDWPYRADDWVDANAKGRFWTPSAQLGDAVLFDHYILHRTQRVPTRRSQRMSCEFRFVPASRAGMVKRWLLRAHSP